MWLVRSVESTKLPVLQRLWEGDVDGPAAMPSVRDRAVRGREVLLGLRRRDDAALQQMQRRTRAGCAVLR